MAHPRSYTLPLSTGSESGPHEVETRGVLYAVMICENVLVLVLKDIEHQLTIIPSKILLMTARWWNFITYYSPVIIHAFEILL